MGSLTVPQQLKLRMLAQGMTITDRARSWLTEATNGRRLSSADYASTSGLILKLDDDVWVNAPVADHNSNFVADDGAVLDLRDGAPSVRFGSLESPAAYALQPAFHSKGATSPALDVVVTHGDRARLSPLQSCSMTCTFCNIPYDMPISAYRLEPIEHCLEALRVALEDPIQPAWHILISGGTPKPKDIGNHQELYLRVLKTFPEVPVDIMMVPIPGILDLPALGAAGLNELSINLEVYDRRCQQAVARQKYNRGRDSYLDFIESAAEQLGPGRVRSMLLVGLEPTESTLEGVEAIARRGGVPVLSPFRPDPVTPLARMRPPSYEELLDVLTRSEEIVAKHGTLLGPTCPPCSHNTLSFAGGKDGHVRYIHEHPAMLETGVSHHASGLTAASTADEPARS
ncbi:MAG: radical SAM protein [Bifidobacteriaceae bacterium]|jgi:hypothetical protein|nr:radical SAM protein [Bifidobacteriaceae bacterium]